MRFTHVLLDLDHTLFDTDTSLRLAFNDALVSVGRDLSASYEFFDEINQALWRRVEAHELSPPEVHIARFVELDRQLGLGADPQTMADTFAKGMGIHGDLYPGTIDVLDQLTEVATLALVTNGLGTVQRSRIARLGIEDHFAAVTISAEVGASKPGTEIFDLTFAALGEPDRSMALMVGDNLGSDIAGGNNAAIATCWYNPSRKPTSDTHPADYMIMSLDELVAIVMGDCSTARH